MKILLIEDDADIASSIGQYLEIRGHQLKFAYTGNQGLCSAIDGRFDLIILDLVLPGKDGIDVCREIRQSARAEVPVLMLTARDSLDDKTEGFNAGADDYLVKPFSLRELELRVQALARRRRGIMRAATLRIEDLVLNRDTIEVQRAGQLISLTPMTFRILEYLMQHADRVVSAGELGDRLWPDAQPGDSLRVHIYSLRQKIDKPFDRELLHTIHGVGYRIGNLTA